MRLSDADREELLGRLSAHVAAGRLTLEELEARIERLDTAETREQAAVILGDLPPLPAGTSQSQRSFWRPKRHGESERPDPAWQPTDERFRDPRSRRIMRVWVDSAGARHYVPED